MKFLLNGIILILFLSQLCSAQWFWQYPPIPSNNLYSAEKIDSTKVLMTGDAGLILSLNTDQRSIDYSYLQLSQKIKDVQFIDTEKGWLITSDGFPNNEGKLFSSTDGGSIWLDLYDFNEQLSDLFVVDAQNLFLLNLSGNLLKSSNGGQNWIQQTFNGATKIEFINDSTGFIVGNFYHRIYKTTDKGDNWQEIFNSQFFSGLHDIKFYNKLHGCMVGESGYFYETSDGGANWTRRFITAGMYNLYSILLFDFQKIVVIGRIESSYSEESVILLSENSGLDWIELGVFNYNLNSLIKVNENEFLAVGDKGVINSYSFIDSSWSRLDQGIKENIISTSFINQQNGWCLSEQGKVLKTVDSGNSWSLGFISSQPQDIFFRIFFCDANNGWITSVRNHELRFFSSTDGGLNWAQSTLNNFGEFKAIYFVSPEIGWIARDHEHILKTTDGGNNWDEQGVIINYDQEPSIEDIQFINENIGYAAGGYVSGLDPYGSPIYNSLLIKTTNGGANWDPIINEGHSNYLVSLSFISDQIGYALEPTKLYKTVDGGTTFVEKSLPNYYSFNTVFFTDDNDGWIAGRNGKIFRTSDSGDSWFSQKVLTSNDLNDICFINDSLGWFVGNNGAIFRFGTSSTNNISTKVPIAAYSLKQNYPNPFNSSTTIKYNTPVSCRVKMRVYNALGEEVAVLVNEEKPAGTYELTWDAADLPSGIYFYQLRAGDFIQTRKMILLK